MSDSQSYKFCHHCGKKFINENLDDHERQCKKNDEQKGKESYDYKKQEQESDKQPVKDDDWGYELKEEDKTLEEKLYQQEIGKKGSDRFRTKPDSTGSQLKTQIKEPTSTGRSIGHKSSTTPKQSRSSKLPEKTIVPRISSHNHSSSKSHKDLHFRKSVHKPSKNSSSDKKSFHKSIKTTSTHQQRSSSGSKEATQPRKNEQKSSKLSELDKKKTKKSSTFIPKKIDPITGKKKSYVSTDSDNQDNKPFPNPRKGGPALKAEVTEKHSSRSCNCVGTSSSHSMKKSDYSRGKSDLKLKQAQISKPFPNAKKTDDVPLPSNVAKKIDDLKLKQAEISKPSPNAKKTDDVPLPNDNAHEVNKMADINQQSVCEYCGQTFKTEDAPTHERLCGGRPFKDHEKKVEKKL